MPGQEALKSQVWSRHLHPNNWKQAGAGDGSDPEFHERDGAGFEVTEAWVLIPSLVTADFGQQWAPTLRLLSI